MVRNNDWSRQFVKKVNVKGRVQCTFCNKQVSDSATRIKSHLKVCKVAPDSVRELIKKYFKEYESRKTLPLCDLSLARTAKTDKRQRIKVEDVNPDHTQQCEESNVEEPVMPLVATVLAEYDQQMSSEAMSFPGISESDDNYDPAFGDILQAQIQQLLDNKNMSEYGESDPEILEKLISHFKALGDPKNKRFNRVAGKVIPVFATREKAIYHLTLEEEHLNSKGSLHGGQTAALVDILTARAVGVPKGDAEASGTVSVELSVSYMRASKQGDLLEIEARVVKAGARVAFTTIEFRKRSDKSVIANGKHTVMFTNPPERKA
ncbi:unnamed protein product [Bursaphelenchus okinawaensis]|uniref:Thioesterase domain-containing protein n=1 Tax=Bursaphelenchus okinawaensis TaxID=465554 RepID=A0A811KLW4_9BILA|nr:unnamed protein product [Bursaphelenchus okinawaensis]CAG9105735.1 unnamed protein product [Bursaphelenchus okinawaensis]